MKYVTKIDSMRAIAVLMVVMSHWIPKTSNTVPFGGIGVDIFFVISGFLITGILLHEKQKAEIENEKPIQVLKNFVSRRALRIFPLYYFCLFIFWWLQDYESYHLRENIGYYASYTSNILFFRLDEWDSYVSPLWSLAVEEQFYLIWPLLLIWTPDRHVFKLIVVAVIVGIIFPYFYQRPLVKILTPACINALGGGALLAWLNYNKPEMLRKARNIFLVAGIFSAMLLMFTIFVNPVLKLQVRTMISMITMVCIMYCIGIYKTNVSLEWIFNSRVLIFIGQISYGIYLYHNIISVVWKNFLVTHLELLPNILGVSWANAVFILLKLVILLLVAWTSFRLFERPFLQMKKYFVLAKHTLHENSPGSTKSAA